MMDLLPWKAGREHRVVDSLRREFNQLFDRFWSGQLEPTALSRWVPAIDVSETDDCVTVAAEVPGL
jgi:HSP20 family molecular chaperone IbpA